METKGGSPLEVMGHGTGLAWGVIEACWKPGDRWENSTGEMTLSLYEITGAVKQYRNRRKKETRGRERKREVTGNRKGEEAFLEGGELWSVDTERAAGSNSV